MSHPSTAALAKVSLFRDLSPDDLATVAGVAEERDVPAGEVLIRQGTTGDQFFLIGTGEVSVHQNGREIRSLGPGDYLGEIALVFGGKRTATAIAAAPTKVYVLDGESFTALLKREPAIERKVMATIDQRMRNR
jgi:CPA1 family monovalent cation:H+ antiporter